MSRLRPVLVGLVAAGLALARLALRGNPFVGEYAEDGAVFLADARTSPLHALVSQYAGYGNLLPRLLALPTVALPDGWWPILTVATALAVLGVICAYTYDAAERAGLEPWKCVTAGLAPALVAGSAVEVLGVWANLQWVLVPTAAWAIVVAGRDDATGRRRDLVVITVTAASSIVSLALFPLVIAVRRRRPVVIAAAIGIAYQVLAVVIPSMSIANRGRKPGALSPVSTVTKVLAATSRAVTTTQVTGGGIAVAVGLVVCAALVVAVALTRDRVALGLVASAAVFAFGATTIAGTDTSRYAVTTLLILLAAGLLTSSPIVVAAVAVTTLAAIVSFPAPAARLDLPRWQPVCQGGRAEAPVGPANWGVARFDC